MKFAGPIAFAALVALAGCGGAKSEDAEYRTAFIGQCEQQMRANPQFPAGVDVRQACSCGVETAFAHKSGVTTYAQSPEGQQAFARALATCVQQRLGAGQTPAAQPAPARPPPAAPVPAPDLVEEEAEINAEGEYTE